MDVQIRHLLKKNIHLLLVYFIVKKLAFKTYAVNKSDT